LRDAALALGRRIAPKCSLTIAIGKKAFYRQAEGLGGRICPCAAGYD
jgi:hypothetical protein